MQFTKITTTPKPINFHYNTIEFIGDVTKKDRSTVILSGDVSGDIELVCDICAKKFKKHIKEHLILKLHNGILNVEENIDLDTIECENEIDFKDLILLEVESLTSQYNYCTNCQY